MRGPRKGLIGPWGHEFPHIATPGPRIDFIGYVQRWFDHWLKGQETGMMEEPMLTYWQQRPEPPRARYEQRQGRWAAERRWPSADVQARTLHLAPGRLQDAPAKFTATLCSPATTGLASGEWCPYGWGPDMPGDQREDDAGSLCFDAPVATTAQQLLGRAQVRLRLCSDNPLAMLAVRLNAVAPDGVAIRISYGLLNFAARNGFDRAEPLVPGHYYDVSVMLKAVAFILPAGYRLRVALSTSYWPLAAPLPVRHVLTVQSGSLVLPLRDPEAATCPPPALGEPWSPPPVPARVLVAPARWRQRLTRDMDDGETTLEVVRNLGALTLEETGLRLEALGR
ncbi:CocE/NonD family hydrolase [Candidatus Sodalis endolongispinus]|uniref:CocE/NonD family hydrolase n=1 Tax=Candidatus Sodalis endolongispinus TaxID=2812662 RepID=A0ABS5YCT9_9GAMM|nr:CocE/NonD family hydrolase [Candidatus Sodalis endolongispinus]MBT9431921.1 CocE/NonD family hydrolase [Candidatus Sodalis endolongispinus]